MSDGTGELVEEVDDSRHPEPERVHSDTGRVLASAENEEWNGNLVPKSQRVEAKRKLIGLQLCAEAMLDECERVRTEGLCSGSII